MTHHPRKATQVGPRTRERLEAYRLRLAVLRQRVVDAVQAGYPKPDTSPMNNMIHIVRSQTRQAEQDRARRAFLLPGSHALTPTNRLETYRAQNFRAGSRTLTVAQARQIRRKAKRAELVELVGRGQATTAELRTWPITEFEREQFGRVGA
jgi:hypothetical protein